jgi:hypothetical protein
MQANLFADLEDDMEAFCSLWEDGAYWDCTDCETDLVPEPGFKALGSCDFSGIENEETRLLTAAGYVQDSNDACWDTCDQDYAEFLAEWHELNGNPSDPCYQAWQNPYNWVTWEHVSGDAGTYSEWSCECERFFWGEC